MGSMLEIMKKVHDADGAPSASEALDAGPATATAVEGIVEPLPEEVAPGASEAAEPSRFAETVHPTGRDVSRFAAVDVVAEAAAVAAAQTQAWDATRIDRAVVAFHARYSAECERFRSLRARLLSMNGVGHCVLAVTSSLPGEGKSVCTLNLGLVMAEGGEQRTLIVDADFRHASITRMLGLEQQAGLADLIGGRGALADLLNPTPHPNLKVLAAGVQSTAGLSDLLSPGTVRQVFADLRNTFDYVFVDMPPVNTVSDASTLAPQCDAAVLVVEMRRTPEPVAQQAVRTLQANNVRLVGCIVTRHDDTRSGGYDAKYDYYRRP
jgi:capsular exopolysaccharide synthesis family protein